MERLGRGHEYVDLDDEPTVYPSPHGSGPLGFSGTATKVSAGAATGLATLAEDDFGIVGFAHVVFDSDPTWGALLDNLHVAQRRTRQGVGVRGIDRDRVVRA